MNPEQNIDTATNIYADLASRLYGQFFESFGNSTLLALGIFLALAILLIVGCCWQTNREARGPALAKERLRVESTPIPEALRANPQTAGGARFDLPKPRRRSWSIHVRKWTLVVSLTRIDKPV